ncbi:MAG: alpha/beta fold hydrolase [Pseudomonadota bacterium]
MTRVLCIAGFGDDSSMFDGLARANLPSQIDFIAIDLPGFGAPPLTGEPTTLAAVAKFVDDACRKHRTQIILAHSVASIIASVAARREGSPIELILSLEGNLTPEDAYFSGKAAQYDTPTEFRDAFLPKLAKKGEDDPIIDRYRRVVERADPTALWQLGRDAHRFSQEHEPGVHLMQSTRTVYLYNPDNLPAVSLQWLENNPIARLELTGVSHWPSVDNPDLLATTIHSALIQEGYADGSVEG